MVRGEDIAAEDDVEGMSNKSPVLKVTSRRRRQKWTKLSPVASAGVDDDTEERGRREQLGACEEEEPD